MKPEVEANLRSIVDFTSPPSVAMRIIELASDPDVDLGQVAKALSLDSALAAKILRIANSPLYARRPGCESVRQALVVIGLNAALTMTLSFSLVKDLRAGKSNGVDYPLYWRRALLAATAARALADAVHHAMPEEIFLAALLQDIGILALDRAIPELYVGTEALQRDHAALARLEWERVQTDHAEVGGWLMDIWRLPERLTRSIAGSHRIEQSSDADTNRTFERCVALSGPVADLFLLDEAHRRFGETARIAQCSLGLDQFAFGQVLATVGAMIPETEALFDSESLAAQHPELIVEQAHEVLLGRSLKALRELASLRAAGSSSAAPAIETLDQ